MVATFRESVVAFKALGSKWRPNFSWRIMNVSYMSPGQSGQSAHLQPRVLANKVYLGAKVEPCRAATNFWERQLFFSCPGHDSILFACFCIMITM